MAERYENLFVFGTNLLGITNITLKSHNSIMNSSFACFEYEKDFKIIINSRSAIEALLIRPFLLLCQYIDL